MNRGRHSAAVANLCSWRKFIALVVSVATAGAWIPFTTGGSMPTHDNEDDDEKFTIPAPLFEGHEFPSWPETHVPGNTQHSTAPAPPKKKPAAKKAVESPKSRPTEKVTHKITPPPVADKPKSILTSFLRAQLGKRYVFGGNGPNSYDCSGLTKAAYAKVGVHLPRTSEEQSLVGTRVSLSKLQIGDLLFWGFGPGLATHVTIYVGGGKFIGAQNPSTGVVEVNLSHDRPNFARRVL